MFFQIIGSNGQSKMAMHKVASILESQDSDDDNSWEEHERLRMISDDLQESSTFLNMISYLKWTP